MPIRDLFAADVTRDIPPVVYFHEQSPAKLEAEVSEYIITGGYPEGHPHYKRVKDGIHEQFVKLFRAISSELRKKGGPELPASWISGFYGSGKSSFAKLVGLALDGAVLPSGTTLDKALLARDDSPKRQELVEAWEELRGRVDPIAVVFDVGGVARDDEHIHSAVLRQVQARLGYCAKSHHVAAFELKLQRDGEWGAFRAAAEKTLGKPWSVAKNDEQAEDHFSHVMHVLHPERYRTPVDWIDSRAGTRTGAGTSPREVVDDIDAMIHLRDEQNTLFIVVDEVSQYIHDNEDRMLRLQSFVADLGQRLKGRVWLLATGQQKLEDEGGASVVSHLKARFPTQLRVHLATTNIRDVVHKRLLAKKPDARPILGALFEKHRADLALYGYQCGEITAEDFVEVYPMLPGHIDLLMQITSNMRWRASSRTQGDDHAIRGLLQLLGELFREQKLADREVGELVTLDAIFEVQRSALDADLQTTLARVLAHTEVEKDELAVRVTKAVALLELIQDQTSTTPELVASCLYERLGAGNRVPAVTEALEKLRALNLITYSEKTGYKIQSSAGQEWQRERDEYPVGSETIVEIVQRNLKALVGGMQERPKHKGRTFPWTIWFSDGRQAQDVKLEDKREESTVAIDFRFLGRQDARASTIWVPKSTQEPLDKRIVWVVGEGAVDGAARELARSIKMVERYRPRLALLPPAKRTLLGEEENRLDELEAKVQVEIERAFHEGAIYFRGQPFRPRELGASFRTTLLAIANRALPELYPHTVDIAVTPSELRQLYEGELTGPSPKFLDGQLGILSLDDQKYVATCKGEHPRRIAQEIEKTGGLTGQTLIATFIGPPHGYPADLVKACVAGLLRGKLVRIRTERGEEISSYRDAGVRDLFEKDKDFRKAELFPPAENPITPRDRTAIARFFENAFDAKLDREDEAFADAAFKYFIPARRDLTEVERSYASLPGRPALPDALAKLAKALEDCVRQRPIQATVVELKRHLNALRDGMQELRLLRAELTHEAVVATQQAANVRDFQLAQLEGFDAAEGLDADRTALVEHFRSDRPWRGGHELEGPMDRIRARYVEVRRKLIQQQTATAEAAEARIRTLTGFDTLTADDAHEVLKPFLDARVDTTAEAVSPTLVEMRDRFDARIGPAEDKARDLLDEKLADREPVVKVETNLRGREIKDRAQLDALLRELETRILEALARGNRVRIL